jgi:hypothetical protein
MLLGRSKRILKSRVCGASAGLVAALLAGAAAPAALALPALAPCGATSTAARRCTIVVGTVRPTQLTFGAIEVAKRTDKLRRMHDDDLAEYLDEHVVPVVIGPGGAVYATDHHHLALAWSNLHGASATLEAEVQANWSGLDAASFVERMQAASYLWLYDENGVGGQPASALPPTMSGLRDDPYRSLAWGVRDAGGYDETDVPHADFRWANYLRGHVDRAKIGRDWSGAVKDGVRAAKLPDASDLPGAP